jgi:predicted acyltransferase
MASPPTSPAPQSRLASLDQFRGYTVAGMFLVTYLGYFLACPFVLRHHNTYCSYADTIMPQFFFAVGFAMRLSFERRVQRQGLAKAYWHMAVRLFGLALIAIFISHQGRPELPAGKPFDWSTIKSMSWLELLDHPVKHDWFQTLMHIAVTSLWILPVLRLAPVWRVLYMVVSAGIHLVLSDAFYFYWVNGAAPGSGAVTLLTGIDGGPLGFLTWTIPTMVGTLACDVMLSSKSGPGKFTRVFGWGVVLMAIGWVLSCGTRWYDVPQEMRPLEEHRQFARNPVLPAMGTLESWWNEELKSGNWSRVLAEPPFVPPPHSAEQPKAGSKEKRPVDESYYYRKWNYWMMSQRSGTISYLTFGAGLSLVIYALFFVLSDVGGLRIGVFRTLGSNALIGYILHDFTGEAVKKFVPDDVPANVMWISFAVFFFVTWLFIRSLEKQKIYIKL